jgi:hypothetical protein
VVKQVGPEEALWLLGCLLDSDADLGTVMTRPELERALVPCLTSANHRERIDAAVLLGLTGFGDDTAEALTREVAKPYAFPEIASIGKGMPDDNFRDKAYLVQALARHIADVDGLRQFADARKRTRDVRYGLTHGLALRGKADAIPLLKELATHDPIALMRQQARYALAEVQDAYRLAGRPVPEVVLPEAQPLEALYPPRGLTWPERRPPEAPRAVVPPPADVEGLGKYLERALSAAHFRNLNNAQASGATRMMTADVEETREAFDALGALPGAAGRRPLLAALDSPYPYAHYLALQGLGRRGERDVIPRLTANLDASLKAQDFVGFWWTCEALGRLRAEEALPVLARLARAGNPPGSYGPEGMPVGYIAAATVARIAANAKQVDVAPLLQSDNPWLRAGALRGLAEAKAPGVQKLLREASGPEEPALVRQEARVQLQR